MWEGRLFSEITQVRLSDFVDLRVIVARIGCHYLYSSFFWRTGLNINSEILRYCRVDRGRYLYTGVDFLRIQTCI